MVKWKELDVEKVEEFCLDQHRRWGEYPSVRDIFYAFVDILWSNTQASYQGVSKWLKKKRLTGEIDWRIIRDGSGRVLEKGDYTQLEPDEYVGYKVKEFIESPKYYHLPRWLNQPKKVIVVCEKEADYPVVRSILSDLNVDTGYQRGYSGWRLLFQIAENIRKEGKPPIIITLGDFDPSGEDIVRFLEEAVRNELGISDLIMEKIAITKSQIERFDLPHRPEDYREMEKLKKDPRFKKWEHGMYRVETASLKSRFPEEFEKILRDAVLKHFDEGIHEKVEEKETELRGEVQGMIDELEERLRNEG